MAEFFLELFSEEIPARMQASGAERLKSALKDMLSGLNAWDIKTYYSARRIALTATFVGGRLDEPVEIRGPRRSAPDVAIAGFLKKNDAKKEHLFVEGDYYVLRKPKEAIPLELLLANSIPTMLSRSFNWPKSMRWGQSGDFTWVRPLRRVVCLLDGELVKFRLGPVESADETEGHRFMAPGAFRVTSAQQWQDELRTRRVIVDADERRRMIAEGLREAAGAKGLSVAGDPGLLDEVAGLVEWPVCLIGAIEPGQMTLPPEVRELSMKVNQRYFATRDADGKPASFFAFVANIEANDGGAAIIAGNERVLRARLADAEHFWALDRKQKLDHYLPKLGAVTFHAKLGSQLERAERISALAGDIAAVLNADEAAVRDAGRAGRLCKADLVTGMVGEFPELQGIMGGYYAEASGEGAKIAGAIRTHYQPKGPSDEVPEGIVACAVALADKIDSLSEFFRIGEKPTGSGDPFALRRAALGVIRIVLENGLRLNLRPLVGEEVFDFLIERLRVKLRGEGKRFDVLNAVLDAAPDDDLTRLIARTDALGEFLATDDGANLLSAYRRSTNILRIEDAKDGPHQGAVDPALLAESAEIALADALEAVDHEARRLLPDEDFGGTMRAFATLRAPVDAFFEHVTVNATGAKLRRNRLRLLARLRDVMHRVADFSKLEG